MPAAGGGMETGSGPHQAGDVGCHRQVPAHHRGVVTAQAVVVIDTACWQPVETHESRLPGTLAVRAICHGSGPPLGQSDTGVGGFIGVVRPRVAGVRVARAGAVITRFGPPRLRGPGPGSSSRRRIGLVGNPGKPQVRGKACAHTSRNVRDRARSPTTFAGRRISKRCGCWTVVGTGGVRIRRYGQATQNPITKPTPDPQRETTSSPLPDRAGAVHRGPAPQDAGSTPRARSGVA